MLAGPGRSGQTRSSGWQRPTRRPSAELEKPRAFAARDISARPTVNIWARDSFRAPHSAEPTRICAWLLRLLCARRAGKQGRAPAGRCHRRLRRCARRPGRSKLGIALRGREGSEASSARRWCRRCSTSSLLRTWVLWARQSPPPVGRFDWRTAVWHLRKQAGARGTVPS